MYQTKQVCSKHTHPLRISFLQKFFKIILGVSGSYDKTSGRNPMVYSIVSKCVLSKSLINVHMDLD